MAAVEFNNTLSSMGDTDYLRVEDLAGRLDIGSSDNRLYQSAGGDLFELDLSSSLITFDSERLERPFEIDDGSLFTVDGDDQYRSGHLFEPASSPLGESSDTGRGLDWRLGSTPQVATSAQPDAAWGWPFGLDGGLSMDSLVLPTALGLGSNFLNDETDLGVVGFGRARAGLSIPGLSVYGDDIPTTAGLNQQFSIDGGAFHVVNLGDAFRAGENTVGWGLGGCFRRGTATSVCPQREY